MPRIAILFDNTVRPETTGFYLRRALAGLADVEHFLPCEFEQLERGDHGRFDLFLAVDDGLTTTIPPALRPLAFWAIDTHLNLDRLLTTALAADHVFAAQKNGVDALRQAGIDSPIWLPLACDPDFHRPHTIDKRFDVAFIGHVPSGPRRELLDVIEAHYPDTFVGRRYLHDMARAWSEARIAFNHSVADDVNMRVFEATACGSLLLTNDLADNGLDDLFVPGTHLVTYRDADEMLDRIAWFLKHDVERERIADAGRRHAIERHTYRHRAATILETVEARRRASVALAPSRVAETSGYFDFDRPEVRALVPETARLVLDIGCGSGRLGEALRKRQPTHVTGVELDASAAAAARARLDQVVGVDIESETVDFADGEFDCVVCADVLEHVRRPERLLRRIRRWLNPDGSLVVSVPNVRHHSVITSLLAGNFTYEPAGLLDATHLRFFTRRELEKLLFRAGFDVEEMQSVSGPGDDDHVAAARAGTVQTGGLRINGMSPADAAEFSTYQYLVRATPRPQHNEALTSIVLVTHNQLDYTRLCLESVRFRTDEPYELIVVDNGSTDGTIEFLRGCRDVRLIENADNRGFPAAVNQGIAAARGKQVLLLNNDTVVTTGWLRRMLDALRSDPRVGLVGPVSNSVSGPQCVPVDYDRLTDLDGFAWDWCRSHRGQTVDLDRLVGFCLLIDRKVIDAIGVLDERFGIGNFEDDDYCRRARQAGFRTVVAADVFVHHFGGRTFAATGVDFAMLLDENRRKFEEKWSADSPPTPARDPGVGGEERNDAPPQLDSESLRTVPASGTGGPGEAGCDAPAGPPGSGPRLSLCMIVRDNERTIRPCLESIRPWVDEMIVVDTGSTDRTPEICRELGARVSHFPWCDDFSAARNQSLLDARGEWIFWMDSDDTIPAECGRQLRALADGPHADNILGFVMQVHCPAHSSNSTTQQSAPVDMTVVDHIKLFRNRPELRFEHRIHEQILPAIRRAGGDVAFTDIHVVHSGSDHTAEGRAGKLDRDFRLLELDLKERPDHPFVLFNLGMTHNDAGQHDQAIHFLQRCLEVSTSGESHVRKAFALLIASLAATHRDEEAQAACEQALSQFPNDPELLFRQAMLHHTAGRLNEAEQTYLRLLNLDDEDSKTTETRTLATSEYPRSVASRAPREADTDATPRSDSTQRGDAPLQNPAQRPARPFRSRDVALAGWKARHNLALVREDLATLAPQQRLRRAA